MGTKGYSIHVMGRNRRLPGYPAIDLGRGLNSTVETSNLKQPQWTQNNKGEHSGNNIFGLLYRDELDMPVLVASHWLVPALVAISGLLLFLSFWRIRQKRRRRRKGSSSGRLGNL
ncbi:Subtilisin-like protease SBT6.1 [Vitis vinifera]|uniref:Subtilisin-like protease SBT6.1 n=1 Tax=Vitis vinifera TaxID=29760 RepID=A0A438DS64_VITVI|nr:Subtilisin-like protease SBT6.1 [Vitis vinifera]